MTRLDEIRARLEAATPGPWTLEESDDSSRRIVGSPGLVIAEPREWEGHMDASLIAHAPADLAYLLDLLDRFADLPNSDLTKVTVFTVGQLDGFYVTVEKTGTQWAIRSGCECLSNDGSGWGYEPQPSSRTEQFIARHRWSDLEQALEAARAYIASREPKGPEETK